MPADFAATFEAHFKGRTTEPIEVEAIIGLPHAADLPGVRRKLHNLAQRTAAKRASGCSQLEDALARIVAR